MVNGLGLVLQHYLLQKFKRYPRVHSLRFRPRLVTLADKASLTRMYKVVTWPDEQPMVNVIMFLVMFLQQVSLHWVILGHCASVVTWVCLRL